MTEDNRISAYSEVPAPSAAQPTPAAQTVAADRSAPPSAPSSVHEKPARSRIGWLALLVSLAALGAMGYQWWQTQLTNEALREELARRLARADHASAQSQQLAGEALQSLRALATRVQTVEGKLAQSQTQQVALESLYQTLLRNQGDWSLAEVEQIANIAAQQLQLAGNVKAAITALDVADARLARMNDAQLLALRRVLQEDLERLKAVPLVDAQGISLRLERLTLQAQDLPLAYLARPARASGATPVPTQSDSTWRRAWSEFKDMVRVQHLEQPAPALLGPEQAYFLRENLKLRLQGARFAVASRDNAGFQADLRAAREWLQRYFDTQSSDTQSALAAIDKLLASDLIVATPDIQASLTAIHDLRVAREKVAPQ